MHQCIDDIKYGICLTQKCISNHHIAHYPLPTEEINCYEYFKSLSKYLCPKIECKIKVLCPYKHIVYSCLCSQCYTCYRRITPDCEKNICINWECMGHHKCDQWKQRLTNLKIKIQPKDVKCPYNMKL